MGQSFLDYAVDPFILGVYAGDPNYLIPKYALPKLYNLEQNYGSFIGGSIKKKRKERDDVNAKKATREVFSAEGGLVNLVKALHKSSGEENFILDAENIVVNREGEKYLITLNHKDEKIVVKANSVISTVGAYNLGKTFPFIEKELIDGITNLHYTKVVEAVIGFKNWKGFNLDGFGGLIPSKEKRDVLGVLFLSSFLKDRAPKDGALLTVFMGGVKNIHLIEKPEEEIKETIIREVKDLMKLEDFNPDLFKIILHNKAIPQYGLDSEIRFKNVELIENQNPGLSIAGNLKDGIGMADRIKQGKMIAERYLI
jgi:oxygen-dependent protoporphyrinogen oxidase